MSGNSGAHRESKALVVVVAGTQSTPASEVPSKNTKMSISSPPSKLSKRKLVVAMAVLILIAIEWFFNGVCMSSYGRRVNDNELDSTISIDTTHQTPTGRNKVTTIGSIFFCGHAYPSLAHAIFPDVTTVGSLFHKTSKNTTTLSPGPHDILLHGLHGPCEHHPFEFPGKVLIIEGESHGSHEAMALAIRKQQLLRTPYHFVEGIYQIGMVPDSSHSMLTFYGPMVLWNDHPEKVAHICDPTLKPKNTGDYEAILYISRNCVAFREQAATELSKIIPVHYGSSCKGDTANGGYNASVQPMPDLQEMKREAPGHSQLIPFYNKYKFCMVMENTKKSLYITEKIILAFLSGCIPIYYGADEVFDMFNKYAFVYYDVNNPQPALEEVHHLVHNETAYMEMLHQEPILANGNDTVRDFFSFSDDVGGGYLKHKLRRLMGIEY